MKEISTMRAKGAVEVVPVSSNLGELYEGISVRIRHVGPHLRTEWQNRLKLFDLEESVRVKEFCEQWDLTEEQFREKFGSYTPEGQKLSVAATRDMLSTTLVGLAGNEVYEGMDLEESLDELERCAILAAVLKIAFDVQTLRPELALSEGPSDMDEEQSAGASEGPGDKESSRPNSPRTHGKSVPGEVRP